MMTEDRLLKPEDHVYDLVDVVKEEGAREARKDKEIIVIDGRVYEHILKADDVVYDLTDVIEEGGPGPLFHKQAVNDEIMKIASETAERIAREIIPLVAERVIREEIEKLKRDNGV